MYCPLPITSHILVAQTPYFLATPKITALAPLTESLRGSSAT